MPGTVVEQIDERHCGEDDGDQKASLPSVSLGALGGP